METADKVVSVPSGHRHVFVVRPPRWIGQNHNLFNDQITEFTEFIPLHPRGAQVLIDPFEVQSGETAISGRVISPAKVLNPGAQIEAWCDGLAITLGDDDLISATTTLHSGTDQIHIRARDDTGLQGRAFISTWAPKLESDELILDAQAGAFRDQEPPPIRKPARYGRTRPEVQRFSIVPALPEGQTVDLVLMDEADAELGRVTLALENEGASRSWTDWVCITSNDLQAEPPLAAIEGRIVRVSSISCKLKLVRMSGADIGQPVRMSGLDQSTGPDFLMEVDDQGQEGTLDLVIGGRFEPDNLNLSWMTTTDADDVLLPGEGAESASSELAGAVSAEASAVSDMELADFSAHTITLPSGWAALVFEGDESGDSWLHEDQLDLMTYRSPETDDSPESGDFVHTARQPRAMWHKTEGWAANPDQVLVKLNDGVNDAQLSQLCREKGLRVAGTVRRDGHVLLESPEPLDFDELAGLVDGLAADAALEVASMNFIELAEENVATVRVPDVLRGAAATSLQPGCYQPYDILTMRHHLQTRTFPAQQLIEHLRLQQTTPSQVSLAITDNGFGNASDPTISADFDAARLPWQGRTPGPGGGTWASFPGNVGATLAFTAPAMIDPGGSGHGTRTLHAMAGHGTTFRSLSATAPPLAPAGAAITNYQTSPWSVGVCPMAQVLPMRTIGVAGGTWFSGMSAIRYAFLQGVEVVNTSAGLNNAAVVPGAAAAGGWYNVLTGPALTQAQAIGGIWVVSGGNRPLAHSQHFHSVLAPTGSRTAVSNPVVAVTPTSQSLLPTEPLGPNFPLSFTNPWHSVETSVLNGWDANFGPESTVAAPGDDLNLRAFSLTAASTSGQLARGSGTSFAAPQTAGLLGLMKLADSIMGRTTPRPSVATPADGANRLIDLMCFTAHTGEPLFTAAEAATQYTNELGHGRIDSWAAVLSTLNGGPMFAGTAPHANLVNTGTYIAPGGNHFYGFELDTPAYHARPWLVNIDTGDAEAMVDELALDPAIDPSDPTRPVWTYQARSGGTGDQILPPSSHSGPDPSYMMQFSMNSRELRQFTHICFQRDVNEPPIVTTPGRLDLDPGVPNLIYYGLPIEPLLNHDVAGPSIAPFNVDMRHFIFKAHTHQHDRRLRLTIDRVEIMAPVVGNAIDVQWTIGTNTSGYKRHVARQGSTVLIAEASEIFYQAANTALDITFEVKNMGATSVTYPAPATPVSTTQTFWGLGSRYLTVAGQFVVHFRVEQEPNLPRQWEATLKSVSLAGAPAGDYIFAVEGAGIRSAWSATVSGLPNNHVIPPATIMSRSPFIPNQNFHVAFLALHLGTMTMHRTTVWPVSKALSSVEVLQGSTAAGRITGTIEIRSTTAPQVFV